MNSKGKIFNIQRFSTSDGPGIRTVVFMKGCPLNCAWCHNPESKSTATELFYKGELCIACGSCSNVCAVNGHTLTDGVHLFDREKCVRCGKCVEGCYSNALEICGEERTAEEVIDIVLHDKPFYEESGGGITLSGGEPLIQYDFTLSLLKLAKQHGLHTAIETSGFSNRDLTILNDFVDLWLYDIKVFPEEEHIKYTGVSNKVIFDNLYQLDRIGARIILRCPIIPDVNMTPQHFTAIADLANTLDNVTAIHLEPYHPLGLSKAEQLGKGQPYQNNKFLEPSVLEPFADMLREKTKKEVVVL